MLRQLAKRTSTPRQLQRICQRQVSSRTKASVADDILSFVRSDEAQSSTSSAQIRDIIRGGIAHQQGIDAARLCMALSELEFEENKWGEAAAAAAEADRFCEPILEASEANARANIDRTEGDDFWEWFGTMRVVDSARELQMRSLLAGGWDIEAADVASSHFQQDQGVLDPRDGGDANPAEEKDVHRTTKLANFVEAKGRFDFTTLAVRGPELPALLDSSVGTNPQAIIPEKEEEDWLFSNALLRIGSVAFCKGLGDAAVTYFKRAICGATAYEKELPSKLRTVSETAGKSKARWLAVTPALFRETQLAGNLGKLQVDLAKANSLESWKECEAPLEETLDMAEKIGEMFKPADAGSATHPRVIPVLMCLAQVYSHTGRVTLAEGLYRTAAKVIYKSQAPSSEFVMRDPKPLHPSLAALLAWRYAQLLTALPKRGGEAELWAGHARELFEANFAGIAIQECFGDVEGLKGKGEQPKGVFIDSTTRRVVLCDKPVVAHS